MCVYREKKDKIKKKEGKYGMEEIKKRMEKAKYGGVWEERKWVGKKMAFLGSKGFLLPSLCLLCCSESY